MGVSLRSIIIALALMPFNALYMASTQVVWISGQPTTLSLFYHVVFILFWLVVANLLIERVRPKWALTPQELLVIYIMLSLASAMGSLDLIDVLVPMMAYLHYYGPIDGRYDEVIEHVPRWLVVTDAHALESYYIGQESFYDPRNFLPWLEPLAWWTAFLFALCAVMWGLNLLLRKQWTEHEKLSYPIIQLPMALSTSARQLFSSRLFWIAFLAAGAIDALNGINHLVPMVPKLPLIHVVDLQQFFTERPWRDMGSVPVSFYPFAIGLCFFMPLDLAFSCWFFFIFWKLQRVLASHIGIHGMPGFPFVEEQTAGGYYAIALIGLWVARHQLLRTVRILMGTEQERTTTWERQEVRIAAVLITLGAAFLYWFCRRAGMTPGVTVAFFVLYYLISIAITRMRAELGPPSHDLHYAGPHLHIMKFLGMANMRVHHPVNLAMLSYFNWFNRAYRGHPMPHGMEGFRIAERVKIDNRRLLIAMAIAIVFGTLCAFWGLLLVLEKDGATQVSGLGEWFGREGWNWAYSYFTAPQPHQPYPIYAIVVGALSAFGLGALRMGLTWWPLHPVGFAVSGSWSMAQLWMSVFVAWTIKAFLLKFGGAQAYKPAVPFFLGLILGDFIVGSFWNLYGGIFHVSVYHFWPY